MFCARSYLDACRTEFCSISPSNNMMQITVSIPMKFNRATLILCSFEAHKNGIRQSRRIHSFKIALYHTLQTRHYASRRHRRASIPSHYTSAFSGILAIRSNILLQHRRRVIVWRRIRATMLPRDPLSGLFRICWEVTQDGRGLQNKR